MGVRMCARACVKLSPDRDCVFMPVLLDSLYCCQDREEGRRRGVEGREDEAGKGGTKGDPKKRP